MIPVPLRLMHSHVPEGDNRQPHRREIRLGSWSLGRTELPEPVVRREGVFLYRPPEIDCPWLVVVLEEGKVTEALHFGSQQDAWSALVHATREFVARQPEATGARLNPASLTFNRFGSF